MPRDYKRMLEAFDRVTAEGLTGDEAAMAAFELNKNDLPASAAINMHIGGRY